MQQNTLGNIAYEITNYLGNVNVVISDRKIWNATPTNAFRAVILSKTDYTALPNIACLIKERGIMPTLISLNKEDIINRRHYFPFGQEISSRNVVVEDYRYGYNGMESDDENKGSGNSYTTEFRQYDPRLGRWLSLDPLMAQYPMMSPYVAFNNNPIYFVDPLGLEGGTPDEPVKGYTCFDESHQEYITYTGDGRWANFSNITKGKNGLIITFTSINGGDDEKKKENKHTQTAVQNDNSNNFNKNYYSIFLSDVRDGFSVAKEFSLARRDVENVVAFRGHGNTGYATFPVGNDGYIILSNEFIEIFKDVNLSNEEIEFYNNLTSFKYLIDNIKTTLIFTNCFFGNTKQGTDSGKTLGNYTKVGQIFMNQDKSPRKQNSNLDYPLSVVESNKINKGWKRFVIIIFGEGQFDFDYNVEETGKSIQMNSKGNLIDQPQIKN